MKARKVLLFIASTIALLAVVALLMPRNQDTFHFPTIGKILASAKKEPTFDTIIPPVDSVALNTILDSAEYFQRILDSSNVRFWFPKDDSTFFDPVFDQLAQAQSQGVVMRVLHYGDSQIEGDRITGKLRTGLQNIFGGGGPGYLPFAPTIGTSLVQQYATGDPTFQSCYGTAARAQGNYGPYIGSHRVAGYASAHIKAGNPRFVDGRARSWNYVRLLYSNRPGPLHAIAKVKNDTLGDDASDMDGVGCFAWHCDSLISEINIHASGSADIFGVLLDRTAGVAVDNIPLRGCSGNQFTEVNQALLSSSYPFMNVKLIIMQFGGNALPCLASEKGVENYVRGLGYQIERLHATCPSAKILFIGPSDMSTSRAGELVTYPLLPLLVKRLQEMANSHNAAYWSIYHAMGGYNSMLAWHSKGWAGDDYIHFSPRGAAIMGEKLTGAFLDVYNLYKLRKRVDKTSNPDPVVIQN